MKVERIKISKLVLDPANARKHSAKNLEAIKGSLKKFGQQKPIVIGKNDVVIAGNGTLEAARSLEWKEIDVVRTSLEGTEAIAFALADNRTGELAEWDTGVLSETLKALETEFDLSAIGFDDDDLAKMIKTEVPAGLTDPDAIPEKVDTRCKPGDLWVLGSHRLLCGDSTNVQHVEKLVGGEKVGLCFTSPPYADQREYNGGKELSTEHLATFIRAAHGSVDLFAINLGLSRKNGCVNQYWDDYIEEASGCGLKLLSWNVWDQLHAGSASKHQAMFSIEHEWVFVFGVSPKDIVKTVPCKLAGQKQSGTRQRERDGTTTPRADYVVSDVKKLGTVIRMGYERGSKGIAHPAKFPVALPEAYIEACTHSVGVVYDPFLGSGSTLIACEKTNRRCFGMEIDPHYCDVILKRWEDYTGKKASLLSTDKQPEKPIKLAKVKNAAKASSQRI